MADNADPNSWGVFDGSFLAFTLVSGILSVIFLLYFNRILGSIISYFIRTYTWHNYKVYVDFKAIQISLLAGRLFFIGFRYHGNNETIFIQHGHITWSYWQRRVRDASIYDELGLESDRHNKDKADHGTNTKLPCLLNVAVSGVEWFVYNRSAAYDSIVDAMLQGSDASATTSQSAYPPANSEPRQRLQKSAAHADRASNGEKDAGPDFKSQSPTSTSLSGDGGVNSTPANSLPFLIQLFPVHFDCDKAALVMGNPNTQAVLVIQTHSLSGEIDASSCQPLDSYRQLFKLRFEKPIIQMKRNQDYKEDQLTGAVRAKQAALIAEPEHHRAFFRRQRRRALGQLRNLVPYWRKSVESFSMGSRRGATTIPDGQVPGTHSWQGLTRYLNDDEDDDKLRWASLEYAAVDTIVNSPAATLTMYWDVPGKVPPSAPGVSEKGPDRVNGAAPPAWAIDISIGGGTINYGPWADRHRAELQRVFFPGLSKDAAPAKKLAVGEYRVPTVFNVYVELDDEVTLRVPTREDSKNWRWRKEADAQREHLQAERQRGRRRGHKQATASSTQQRPYGWLDVKVARNTTVSYSMDMVAGPSGYSNSLNIDLPSTEVSTSVNHGILWKSGAQRICCDMSAPLKWNALRTWRFDISSDGLELYLLRDHIFLLTDLVNDWGSGPPGEYLLFTPFRYMLNLQLQHVKLFLNVNDVNVIDNPLDPDDNSFLIIESPSLVVDSCIPLDQFRPPSSSIPFDISAESLSFALHVPPWNTQASFLASKDIGQLEKLRVNGKYHYLATTSPANTDTLVLNISGQSPTARIFGFHIRYFLQLKDNYFGDYVHFRTLDEYQESIRLEDADPVAAAAAKPPTKKSNDLDVMLSIRIDDPRILLPANMYSSHRHIAIETAAIAVDLRFTNYYMDLELDVSPLSLSNDTDTSGATSPLSASTTTQLFIDGLRIYGHRVFGLPPTEPTYLCNWDISVGAITGECNPDFLTALVHGGKAFGFSFDDDENALIPFSSVVVFDVTFLRVAVASVMVWLRVDEAAFLCSTGSIHVDFNDWARSHYSRRADISIPNLELACVNPESAIRRRTQAQPLAKTDAFFRTTIKFALIGRKHDFAKARQLQQELIRRHDQRTQRTDFLLLPDLLGAFTSDAVDPVAQSVPSVPQPVSKSDSATDKASLKSGGSLCKDGRLRKKSSFLSLSSKSSLQSIQARPFALRGREYQSGQLHPHHHTSRPGVPVRDFSASTGRHSAFYSANDEEPARPDPPHSTVAFSSQYFAPYFPLDNVVPEFKESILPGLGHDIKKGTDHDSVLDAAAEFSLEDIDADALPQDIPHQSLIIELPDGVVAFCDAQALRHIASLMAALQPTDPEDILDALQISAMTDVLDFRKEKELSGKITDIALRLPHASVRFLNNSHHDSESSDDQQDQYDLSLQSVSLVIRSRSQPDITRESGHDVKSSVHFQLASAEFSAAERLAALGQTQAAVVTNIDKVLVTLGSKDVTYVDAEVGALRTTSTSGKVEYLASLIHRTKCLGSEMGDLFSSTMARADNRVQHLVRALSAEMQTTGDPPFLVRPSTILRVANDHLRTYDSWKMIMRLRQLWTVLDTRSREHIIMDCLNGTTEAQPGTRQQLMSAFEAWRQWDLANPRRTFLSTAIFGKQLQEEEQATLPLMVVARVQQAQLVLDPGPKQNHAFLVDLTVRVEENTEHAPQNPVVEAPVTNVNVYCGHAGLNLNWELCELVEDILRLSGQVETPEPPLRMPEKATDRDLAILKQASPRVFHVVTVMALGSLVFETINLTADNKTEDLSLSTIISNENGTPQSVNVLLECDTASSKLSSHAQSISTCRFERPSIFVDYAAQRSSPSDKAQAVKLVASSDDLKLTIKQDPLALAEIVDMLVRDEVAQLYQLQKKVPQSKTTATKSSEPAKSTAAIQLNLTMFMNSYKITVPLLRSIIYTISGDVARAKIAGSLGKEMVFDFDIKQNEHHMQVKVNNKPRGISLLKIPPTNGRVTSIQTSTEHTIAVFASIEEIELDASNVYSLLSALNRPEISSTVSELRQQGKTIEAQLNEIFDKPAKSQPVVSEHHSLQLVYEVHGALAGLTIFGATPLSSDAGMSAGLTFGLQSVHLHLSNKAEQGRVLAKPEFHVNLKKILLNIEKGPMGELRSCGSMESGALLTANTREADDGTELRSFDFKSDGFELNFSSDTVATVIDVIGYLGDKIKDLDTSRELEYLRKLRQSRPKIIINDDEVETDEAETDIFDTFLSSISYSFEVKNIKLCWLVSGTSRRSNSGEEDLVLSFERVEFGTRQKKMARLLIQNLQLQLVEPGHDKIIRSANSALMPEAVFNIAYVSTDHARRLAFQAVGKSLDIRLTSAFIIPVKHLQDSIILSMKNVQHASETWAPIVPPHEKSAESPSRDTPGPTKSIFGSKRLESLLIDADFAGAVVHLSAKRPDSEPGPNWGHSKRISVGGKYGQFSGGDGGGGTILRTPGLALKAEYRDSGREDPAVYAELKVDGSRNILYPAVVPLILDITSSIKDVVGSDTPPATPTTVETPSSAKSGSERAPEESNILTADPSAVLGGVKLNLGLRICQQEFTLSSQPIGRVAATISFGDIYLTANTVHSPENGNFFAISGVFSQFKTAVQHVYSRESTASFEVDSIVVSLMNSKHVSGTSGISAIIKVSPMAMVVNARQLQDFLLFREIWLPRDVRATPAVPLAKETSDLSQGHLMQRYQQVAATAAFPWTASLSITALNVKVDLGQSLGKSEFSINDFWISSKKTSDWEQNLCLGFREIGMDFKGRLSGFITLQTFKLRTSIEWPERKQALNKTPRIQASIGFRQFRMKGAFDYQAFLVADITSMEFLMYNVRQGRGDRLVAIVDAGAVQIFGVTSSASQVVALWQAIQKLIAERKAGFESSLKDIEKFIQRRSTIAAGAGAGTVVPPTPKKLPEDDIAAKSPISLDTDVIVVLKTLNLGVFPSTFSDRQVFKLEASNAQLRFAASMENQRIHSVLGLTLGQLRIGLAGVRGTSTAPPSVNDLSVEDVVQSATGSRGGTILKVPRVEAVMQTFQRPDSRTIEYIFKSAFEGKVEVGWNYSRIVSIRGMWANHSRLLAQTWGRELPAISAIKVTGVPEPEPERNGEEQDTAGNNSSSQQEQQQKITAEVNVPQSKFEYIALEPPIIETPQLRDMGEATPPLEWIGVNRDRLPNLTHQIVIVSLLELAGEVEDAYAKILGSS
ncbi:fermentation associated protein [Microdochium bolleyi]|uniref:Fermentation associated protein n=1 Tax=Microdochium bolleyi TaxID=196109 RepID=A0A136J5M1_9PEZI|nr:fermentation associated protein [Microdochium bolleyi]